MNREVNKLKKLLFFMVFLVALTSSISGANVFLSDQGTDVRDIGTGDLLDGGDLTVEIWDAESGGAQVYTETFFNSINNGSWNVMLGAGTTNLSLEYGALYYKNYVIDTDDINFEGNADRLAFFSPLGEVGSEDLASGVGSVPKNTISAFNQDDCPVGWVLADGTSGTPDLRGIFIRGAGTSGTYQVSGTNFTATFGEFQNDSFQGHWHEKYYRNRALLTSGENGAVDNIGAEEVNKLADNLKSVRNPITDGINSVPRTAYETRPASYGLIYCMKTAEDSAVSNSLWQEGGGVVSLSNASNNLEINGNITADYFIGDGSQLTGIMGGIWTKILDAATYIAGNVGIGTTTPQANLHIADDDGAKIILSPNTGLYNGNATMIQFSESNDSGKGYGMAIRYDGTAGGGKLQFMEYDDVINQTDNVWMSIDKDTGGIGIGTINPLAKLSVYNGADSPIVSLGSHGGTVEILRDSNYGLLIGTEGSGNSWLQAQRTDGTATAYNLLLQPSGGNVGIGIANPSAKLHIVGNVNITGNLTLDGGKIIAPETTKVQAKQEGTQILLISGTTGNNIIGYTGEQVDSLGEWNGNFFTPKETGYYQVSASTQTDSIAWDVYDSFSIYLNLDGAIYDRGTENYVLTPITTSFSSELNTMIYLTAGQDISIYATMHRASGDSVPVSSGSITVFKVN